MLRIFFHALVIAGQELKYTIWNILIALSQIYLFRGTLNKVYIDHLKDHYFLLLVYLQNLVVFNIEVRVRITKVALSSIFYNLLIDMGLWKEFFRNNLNYISLTIECTWIFSVAQFLKIVYKYVLSLFDFVFRQFLICLFDANLIS